MNGAPTRRRCRMKRQRVSPFGQFHQDRILGALVRIVFGDFGAQTSGLDTNQRIQLRIEISGTPENFRRNLIFLQRDSWMSDRMLGQVTQKLAERF